MSSRAQVPSGRVYSLDRSGWPSAVWLACGIAIVVLLPSQLVFGHPLWKAHVSRILLALLMAAPLVAAPIADRQRGSSGTVQWLAAAGIAVASYVPVLLYVLLFAPGSDIAFLLISMTAGTAVVLVALLAGRRHLGKAAVVAGILVSALLGTGLALGNTPGWTISALSARVSGPNSGVRAVTTLLHALKVTTYRRYVDAKVAGGGIANLGKGYLAASGEGGLFYFEREAESGNLSATRLGASVPINHAQFFAETTQAGSPQATLAPTWFRALDLLAEERGESTALYVVHNFWKSVERCSVVRVSRLSAPTQDFASDRLASAWETIYESTPCLTVTNEGQGGRLIRLPDGSLLLTVGLHDDRNGLDGRLAEGHYGKTILIDESAKSGSVFTSGHRNPQGLVRTHDGDLWLTEHGPRGGDELNRLVKGTNFGWPVVSYGVQYHPGEPPTSGSSGSHAAFEPPVFSWARSSGISNLIEVSGELFPRWKDDLLIASLVRNSLWRARIVDRRVASLEEINLDDRLRDIIQDPAGRIVIWTDQHSLIFIEPADTGPGSRDMDEASRAELAFAKCAACHQVADGTRHGIGPDLHGVFGREVAGSNGYAYSHALQNAGGSWDEESLDRFLANPQAFAPGMRAEMQAVTDADERRLLIRHLQSPD